MDISFALPHKEVSAVFSIGISLEGGESFGGAIDDIRIQPFNSSMTTYVYDPVSLRLSAALDKQNFADFYYYDEEGKLVQQKKETERGVLTVHSCRENISRK